MISPPQILKKSKKNISAKKRSAWNIKNMSSCPRPITCGPSRAWKCRENRCAPPTNYCSCVSTWAMRKNSWARSSAGSSSTKSFLIKKKLLHLPAPQRVDQQGQGGSAGGTWTQSQHHRRPASIHSPPSSDAQDNR